MRALFHSNVDFAAWSAHLAAAMRRRDPDFSADIVITLDATVRAALERQDVFRFGVVEAATDLETTWIAGDPKRIEYWKDVLGGAAVTHVGTADRELSGFAEPNAFFPRSPLQVATADVRQRNAYLAGLLDWLDARLEKSRPHFVVATSLQDCVGVALAYLARLRGIAFFSPKATGFGQFVNLYTDPLNMMPSFAEEFARIIHRPDSDTVLLGEGMRMLTAFRARPSGPEYMSSPVNKPAPWPSMIDTLALFWRILRSRPPEDMRQPFAVSRLQEDWRRALAGRFLLIRGTFEPLDRDLLEQPFVYFPLHYEPEASLLVSAPTQTDQMAAIEALCSALPEGWQLYVKEHRPMIGRRPLDFYSRLRSMKKVRLVDPFCDSLLLVRFARVTATITGTAGLEAVLLGRPTLFFGDNPVQIIAQGFHRLEGRPISVREGLISAIRTREADNYRLALFLGLMARKGVHHSVDKIWGSLDRVSFNAVYSSEKAVDQLAALVWEAIEPA